MVSRIVDNGDLHIHTPEYVRIVHCDTTYPWPLFGGRSEAGIAVPQVVMGIGGSIFSGPAGGGEGRRGQGWVQDQDQIEGGGVEGVAVGGGDLD